MVCAGSERGDLLQPDPRCAEVAELEADTKWHTVPTDLERRHLVGQWLELLDSADPAQRLLGARRLHYVVRAAANLVRY